MKFSKTEWEIDKKIKHFKELKNSDLQNLFADIW